MIVAIRSYSCIDYRIHLGLLPEVQTGSNPEVSVKTGHSGYPDKAAVAIT